LGNPQNLQNEEKEVKRILEKYKERRKELKKKREKEMEKLRGILENGDKKELLIIDAGINMLNSLEELNFGEAETIAQQFDNTYCGAFRKLWGVFD